MCYHALASIRLKLLDTVFNVSMYYTLNKWESTHIYLFWMENPDNEWWTWSWIHGTMEELQQMKIVGETVRQVTANEYTVTPGLGAAGPANDMYYLLLQEEQEKSNRVERSSTIVRHHSLGGEDFNFSSFEKTLRGRFQFCC